MTSGPLLVDAGSVVVSGAAIDLNAQEHSMNFNTFWNVPDTPGKATGSNFNTRLSQGRYAGYTGPVHQITGYYDDTGRGYNNFTSLANNGAYFLTGSMLVGIALSGSQFALIDSEVIKARDYGSGSMTYVVPIDYSVSRAVTSSAGAGSVGYIVNYNLKLKEVQV